MIFEEKTVESERIYEGKILNLRRDRVEVRGGESFREIVEHRGGVVAIPIKSDGKVVLVKQYRKAVGRVLLEAPAGKLEEGENPEEAIARELKEETGYTAASYRLMTTMLPSPGYTEERLYIYLATGLTEGEPEPDANEELEIVEIPMKDSYERTISGEIEDGKTALGILMAYYKYAEEKHEGELYVSGEF